MEGPSKAENPPKSELESGWWSSWLNSAREKSVSALNATKRDLAEFVTVLGSDTKAAVSGAGQNIKGLMKESDEPDNNGSPTSKPKVSTVEAPSAPYDRSQAQLFAVQNTEDTYLTDPKGDKYSDWRSKFNVQACQSEISNLLVSCSRVRSLHSQLVPAKVSYETFWMRYFYKVQLLEQEEKLRAELMARASKPSDHQLQWDEDFEEVGVESLPKPEVERSEASSDSFVCVSESVINDGERGVSQDPEGWELMGGDSQDSPGSPKSPASQNENKDKNFDIDDLLGDDTPVAIATEGGGQTTEDCNSDWENWDD